ncbi:hypothetical protein C5748_06725 [Phyllobacterium phragmitis]|uniref:DUF2189 domain-containing protein n=1 Tax=Phyllobacterium phragmitis TaxID=2670329 RepID=A0A2S9IUU2_9HYPH|nr:DUF2189 domain-containing protein [Phyllobacterium phragmitis]PRD44281.1 hypothetical protein C5748_06725 [Phyllobacterium phragmitis]
MAHFHVIAGASETPAFPQVRRIGVSDVVAVLRQGLDDFWDKPSHYVFLCLIYPIAGLVIARWTSGANTLPLLYPLMSGFALLGPLAAIGLYEISRRRELGLDTSWRYAFDVVRSPAIPSIMAVAALLFAIFIAWLLTAQALYGNLFGPMAADTISGFLRQVFATEQGLRLIVWGNLIGFVFAVVVLCTTVVTFPLLLDRDVGALVAVWTSIKTVLVNPVAMALWGLIVAALLVVGFVTLFAGLAVVIPVLGHATWHLYRRVVAPEASMQARKKAGGRAAA